MTTTRQNRGAAIAAVLAFAALWGAAVYWLYAANNEDWSTGVFVMAIFGVALSGLTWLLTLGAKAPAIEVKRPALESGALLAYLAVYAVGFLGFGMSAARDVFPEGPQEELLVMALKLMAHIVLPAALLLLLGARIAPLFFTRTRAFTFWFTLIVLGVVFLGLLSVISPSLQNIAATNATPSLLAWVAPVSFVWVTIEAGLNEEFLFRAVLQTRLSAWFRSPWAGVIVTSLLFGLAHAPGLYLRGGLDVDGSSPDLLQVIAYTIAVLAPMGLLFGLIYARTKSLLLVVLLHGLVDVLPNMADFIRLWTPHE